MQAHVGSGLEGHVILAQRKNHAPCWRQQRIESGSVCPRISQKRSFIFQQTHQEKSQLTVAPIYAAISLRFFGILLLQFMTRTFSHFRKKPDTTDEAARTWLYRSCIKNEFNIDPFKELLRDKLENSKPDTIIPPTRPGSHQLPN